MRRSIAALMLGLIFALALVGTASAHANLVRSVPAAGALLDAAPARLELEFSEELDPGFSRVQLYNGANQVVNAGPGVVDPAAPTMMRLDLGALPKNSYTAVWRVRSAADGHITEGSVPFGVGVAAPASALIPAPGTPDPATVPPPPLDAAARWLNLLALTFAFGGLPFGLLVWRPAYRHAESDDRRPTTDASTVPGGSSVAGDRWSVADDAMTRAIRRIVLVGGALFLLTNLVFLLTQAADAAGVPLLAAFGAPVAQLLAGRSGQLIGARLVLTLLIIVLARRLPPASRGATLRWWAALVLLGAIVLTFSLSAHAAAVAQNVGLAVALDWLHVAAMVLWVGGLLPLAFAIRAARRHPERALPLGTLIPRFSWVALPCVLVLTLTGLYSYLLHVGNLDLLVATTYGRALAVKIGLFVLLFLLGALNLGLLSRRLRSGSNRLARRFGRSVRAELAIGAMVLLAVGVMTSVAPSTTAWEAHQRLGLAQELRQGDVDLTLRVAPAQIGDNEWAVDVIDKRPGAASAPAKVLLRFDMQGMAMGKLQAETSTSDNERYIARGSYTSMGGRWDVEVILRRAGFDDVAHTFVMDIVRSPDAVLAP